MAQKRLSMPFLSIAIIFGSCLSSLICVSNQEFTVLVVRNVSILMRDSVNLSADIYFPAKRGKILPCPWPVILERTPYGKSGTQTASLRMMSEGELFAKRGYVCVVQDVRGRGLSEGKFQIYGQEAEDGYDTIKWINGQRWSNGKIGLKGESYSAAAAHAILVQHPPGIAAVFIREGSANYHEDGVWQGGAFELLHNVGYALELASSGKEAVANQSVLTALNRAREIVYFAKWLQAAPLKKGASPLALAPSYERWYMDWQTHNLYDWYWKRNGYNVEEFYDKIADIPILLIAGWYDRFLRGSLNNFLGYSQHNSSPVHLYILPVVHGSGKMSAEATFAGDVEFGENAALNDAIAGNRLQKLKIQWFDRWLKGCSSGLKEGNFVRLFRMGGGSGVKNADGRMQAGGKWQEFDVWPPTDIDYTKFYLTPGMRLQTRIPENGTITYVYDPANPVPTIGGNLTLGGKIAPSGAYDQRYRKDLLISGNGIPLSARQDILSFITPTLTEDLDVTGPLTVYLCVSSNVVDTDFTAKLIDVYPPSRDYPEGYSMNLADSIVRARFHAYEQLGPHYHRNYAIREELLKPGKIYEVTIDLWATSNLFSAGHRIRLDISSSNYPRFDVNFNTGDPYWKQTHPPIKAHNTIYTGSEHPSHIVLPIRPSVKQRKERKN